MATNLYMNYTKVNSWNVPANTQPGDLVEDPKNAGRFGVAIVASGDASVTLPNGAVVNNGGVGVEPYTSTIALDGSWVFAIAGGAVDGSTIGSGSAGTDVNTPVYFVDKNTVTLTGGGGAKRVGSIDAGFIVGGKGPIKIGEVL